MEKLATLITWVGPFGVQVDLPHGGSDQGDSVPFGLVLLHDRLGLLLPIHGDDGRAAVLHQ